MTLIYSNIILIKYFEEAFLMSRVGKTPRGVRVLAMAVFSLYYWNWFC
jgi:hypothetical protein